MKSALELAMERANSIPVDKEARAKEQLGQEGMKIAALLFNEDLATFQKAYAQAQVTQELLLGILKVFQANMVLPATPEQHTRLALVREACLLINASCEPVLIALDEVLATYQSQAMELATHLRTQIDELLAAKEEKHLRQTGQRIALTMESDKEAMALYQKQFNQFQSHYQGYLTDIKHQLSALIAPT